MYSFVVKEKKKTLLWWELYHPKQDIQIPSNASSYKSSCFSPLTIKAIWLAMSTWLRHWYLHCTCLRWSEINPWFLLFSHLRDLASEYHCNTLPAPLEIFKCLGIRPWISHYWPFKYWLKKQLWSYSIKNNFLSILTE